MAVCFLALLTGNFPEISKACLFDALDRGSPETASLFSWRAVAHIADPASLATREARFFRFTFKARTCATEHRRIDPFQRVHIDDRIEFASDEAGDDRRDAASGAHVKIRSASTERVSGHRPFVFDGNSKRSCRTGCPDAAMFHAEAAATGPRRNLARLRCPAQSQRDIAAVTSTLNQHDASSDPDTRASPISRRCSNGNGLPPASRGERPVTANPFAR